MKKQVFSILLFVLYFSLGLAAQGGNKMKVKNGMTLEVKSGTVLKVFDKNIDLKTNLAADQTKTTKGLSPFKVIEKKEYKKKNYYVLELLTLPDYLNFDNTALASVKGSNLFINVDDVGQHFFLSTEDLDGYLEDESIRNKNISLPKAQIKKLINEQFGNLMSAEASNNIGNYAALDLSETEVDFSGNIIFPKGSILGVRATGGVSDGLLPIFNNGALNTNVGLEIQYNFLKGELSNAAQFDVDAIMEYQQKLDKVEEQSRLEEIKIKQDQDIKKLQHQLNQLHLKQDELSSAIALADYETKHEADIIKSKKEKLEADKKEFSNQKSGKSKKKTDGKNINFEITKLEKQIEVLEAQLKRINKRAPNYTSPLQDSLLYEMAKLELEINKTKSQIKWSDPKATRLERQQNASAKKRKALEKSTKIKTHGCYLTFITLGYKVENQTFRLLDPTNVNLDDQITKRNFATQEFSFRWSVYNLREATAESFFLSSGFSLEIGDNFSTLDKIKVNERSNFGPNPDDRYSIKEFNAYIDDGYKNKLKTFRLHTDFYWFLFEKNQGAIHIYPEYKVQEGEKNTFNLGTGVLMSFKDKEDKKNTINVEAYFNFLDLENVNESEDNLIKRSTFGLRFAFPINFKFIDND